MAQQFFMSGPATVTFDGQVLGLNRGEIPISIQPRFIDVPTDEFGGSEGVPADAQFMGAIATVQLQLTKYDPTIMQKVLRLVPFASSSYEYGEFPAIGTFVKQQGMARALKLTSINETRLFDVAFIRNPFECNMSARYRVYMVSFECWMDAAATRELFVFRNAADDADIAIASAPNHTNTSNTALS